MAYNVYRRSDRNSTPPEPQHHPATGSGKEEVTCEKGTLCSLLALREGFIVSDAFAVSFFNALRICSSVYFFLLLL